MRFSTKTILSSLLLSLLLPVLAQADDWPTFRHDNRRSGTTAEAFEVTQLAPAWQWQSPWRPVTAWHGAADVDAYRKIKELGDARNYDSAYFTVVVGQRVYFGSSADDALRCLNLTTGEELWSYVSGGPIRIAPTVAEGRVYFGCDDGYAYCLDAENGELVWRYRPAGTERRVMVDGRLISQWPCRSGVLVVEGTAYFSAGMLPWMPSYLCAVDAVTGQLSGEEHFERRYDAGHTPEAAMLATSDRIFVPQGKLGPAIMQLSDGEPLGTLPGASTFAVLSSEEGLFSGPFSRDIGLRGTDAETRQEVAYHPTAVAMLAEGDIYYLLAEGAVWALNNADRSNLWSTPVEGGCSLIRAGDHLLVGGDGQVWALEVATGEIVWQMPVGGRAYGLTAANGALVVSLDTGSLEVFQLDADAEFVLPAVEAASEEAEQAAQLETRTPLIAPYVQFTGPGRAVIRWETEEPCSTVVEFRLGEQTFEYVDATPVTQHEATWSGLQAERVYGYRALGEVEGELVQFGGGSLDTFYNYLPPALEAQEEAADLPFGELCEAFGVYCQSEFPQGLCMVLGDVEGTLAPQLATLGDLRVVVVESNAQRAAALRERWLAAGVYGPRLVVLEAENLATLPLPGMLANVIVVAEGDAPSYDPAVLARLLRPQGGVLIDQNPATAAEAYWQAAEGFAVQASADAGGLLVLRGELPGAADWTHQYGSGANAGFTGETLGGARASTDFDLQWLGRPGPRYHADRQVRKPAPLSVAGRMFAQGQERIIALDAYNGMPLWSLELPGLQRYDIPHDASNWTADDEYLYVALGDRAWQLEAATGHVARRLPITPGGRDEVNYHWGYIGSQGDYLVGSANAREANHTGWWGGEFWYDGEVNTLAASDRLFAYGKTSGETAWSYEGAVIVNTSIVTSDDRVYFVETRDEETVGNYAGRIMLNEHWPEPHLVALDLATGEVVWRKPLPQLPAQATFSVALGEDRIITNASTDGVFHVAAYSTEDGEPIWQRDLPWVFRGHGAHYSRPVIVGERLFVRPNVVDLATGEPLELKMPGGGCGTYCATSDAFIFRSGDIALWSPETEQLSSFQRLRPGCWLNAIPAGGLLLAPEAGGGCSCGIWLETSAAFAPAAYPPPSLKTRDRGFVDQMTLELFNRVAGGEIRYTFDGTPPTPESPLYEEPIDIEFDVALSAATFWPQEDGTVRESTPISADFKRSYPTPAIEGNVIAFTEELEVALRQNGETGQMHYTLDGTDPTLDSPRLEGTTITLTDSCVLSVSTIWQFDDPAAPQPVVISPPSRKEYTRVEARTPSEELRINFTHASFPVAEGYESDYGNDFRVHPNGYTYGWTEDLWGRIRSRGDREDKLRCPFFEMQPGATWEIAVENGDYEVTVCIGEIFYGVEKGTIYVEGVTFCEDVELERYETREYTETVTVTDGRITLTTHDDPRGNKSTRLNYLHITPVE